MDETYTDIVLSLMGERLKEFESIRIEINMIGIDEDGNETHLIKPIEMNKAKDVDAIMEDETL